MLNNESSPTVTNCTFTNNLADIDGGGMRNVNNSDPMVTNCAFSGNRADKGAGMINENGSNPTVTNCTFSGNSADYGGGIYSRTRSKPRVTNCIFWGNTPNQIYCDGSSAVTVSHSDVEGGWTGNDNIDDDPCFVDAAGGDLRLLPGSPCIDAGDNDAVPIDIETDLDGNRRVADGDHSGSEDIDIGAYEVQRPVDDVTKGT